MWNSFVSQSRTKPIQGFVNPVALELLMLALLALASSALAGTTTLCAAAWNDSPDITSMDLTLKWGAATVHLDVAGAGSANTACTTVSKRTAKKQGTFTAIIHMRDGREITTDAALVMPLEMRRRNPTMLYHYLPTAGGMISVEGLSIQTYLE